MVTTTEKLPYMPLYCDDFTAILARHTILEGHVFVRLVLYGWSKGGWIPNDRKRMRMVCQTVDQDGIPIPADQLDQAIQVVIDENFEFKSGDNTKLVWQPQAKSWAEGDALRERARAGGRAKAEKDRQRREREQSAKQTPIQAAAEQSAKDVLAECLAAAPAHPVPADVHPQAPSEFAPIAQRNGERPPEQENGAIGVLGGCLPAAKSLPTNANTNRYNPPNPPFTKGGTVPEFFCPEVRTGRRRKTPLEIVMEWRDWKLALDAQRARDAENAKEPAGELEAVA